MAIGFETGEASLALNPKPAFGFTSAKPRTAAKRRNHGLRASISARRGHRSSSSHNSPAASWGFTVGGNGRAHFYNRSPPSHAARAFAENRHAATSRRTCS
jgi:hypothetical protein